MAEKAKEQPKDINLEMDNLTPKGKIHAEQYNNLKIQKIQHQMNIVFLLVLLMITSLWFSKQRTYRNLVRVITM